MKKYTLLSLVILTLLAGIPAMASSGNTSPAQSVVAKFYDQLVGVMKTGEQLGFAGRYKKLESVMQSAFNLPTMTRFSVGSAWAKTAPDQQQQLIKAFSNFSVATYASRFKAYGGEKFEVTGEKIVDANTTMVETKLTPKGEEPVILNYLMKKNAGGQYQIVDVFLNATISELATRRAEFGSIVRSQGVEALVSALGEKSKKMGPT